MRLIGKFGAIFETARQVQKLITNDIFGGLVNLFE